MMTARERTGSPAATARRECETRIPLSGLPCAATARWLVQVGTRRTDAQLSCGTHLSMTCALFLSAEDRPGASLTVTEVAS